jgi:hypothetical protein
MNRFLVVSSNDKTSDSLNNGDFKVRLGDTYFSQQVCGISVVSCTVPNIIYNINEYNNVLRISRDPINLPPFDAVSTITIPVGQYTINDLTTELSTQIGLANLSPPIALTIIQDPITQKLKFETLGGFIFYNTVLNPSSIWSVLGLDSKITQYISVNAPLPSLLDEINAPYIPNLSGSQYVNILSNLSENNSIDGQGVKSLLEIVSFYDTPFGGMHTQTTNMAEHAVITYVNPRNLNNITIKLVDENYRAIDIENFPVTVVLRIYFAQ